MMRELSDVFVTSEQNMLPVYPVHELDWSVSVGKWFRIHVLRTFENNNHYSVMQFFWRNLQILFPKHNEEFVIFMKIWTNTKFRRVAAKIPFEFLL